MACQKLSRCDITPQKRGASKTHFRDGIRAKKMRGLQQKGCNQTKLFLLGHRRFSRDDETKKSLLMPFSIIFHAIAPFHVAIFARIYFWLRKKSIFLRCSYWGHAWIDPFQVEQKQIKGRCRGQIGKDRILGIVITFFISYLGELCVEESVDEGGFSDATVAHEDHVAVVAGLGQSLADAAHREALMTWGSHRENSWGRNEISWKNTKLKGSDVSARPNTNRAKLQLAKKKEPPRSIGRPGRVEQVEQGRDRVATLVLLIPIFWNVVYLNRLVFKSCAS